MNPLFEFLRSDTERLPRSRDQATRSIFPIAPSSYATAALQPLLGRSYRGGFRRGPLESSPLLAPDWLQSASRVVELLASQWPFQMASTILDVSAFVQQELLCRIGSTECEGVL